MAKYVATEPLFVGRFRAHNPGDEVPEKNVKRNGWQDKVKRAKAPKSAEPDDQPTGGKPADGKDQK